MMIAVKGNQKMNALGRKLESEMEKGLIRLMHCGCVHAVCNMLYVLPCV